MLFTNSLAALAPTLAGLLPFLTATNAFPHAGVAKQIIGRDYGGWCTMHVVQYQKNEPPVTTDQYRFNLTIFDPTGRFIGDNNFCENPCTITAYLPASTLTATAGEVDNDAVLFDYADQHWGSNDQEHHSNFGAYDNGFRQGDTGFSC